MAGRNDILASLAVVFSAQTAELTKGVSKVQRELDSFSGGLKKITGAIGLAFGAQQVASFALEISKLAGEAKGVKAAFDRLPNSIEILRDLKQVTGGTVSELELMKQTVQAFNFGISLEQLPRLLEFATLRAQQTGESVEFLSDSIVKGIGRKSLLILDNLGISATAVRDKLNGVALASVSVEEATRVIGEVAEESLGNMAEFSENASTKVQRLAASWDNYKVSIGTAANETGLLGGAIDGLTDRLDALASQDLSFFQKLGSIYGGTGGLAIKAERLLAEQKRINEEIKIQEQVVREVDRAYKEFNGDLEAYTKVITTHIYKEQLLEEFKKRLNAQLVEEESNLETIANLTKKVSDLEEEQSVTIAGPVLSSINKQIAAYKEKIKALKELGTLQGLSRGATSGNPEIKSVTNAPNPFSNIDLLADTQIDKIKALGISLDILKDKYISTGQAGVDSAEASKIKQAELEERLLQTAQAAVQMGDIIGTAFGNIISGQDNMLSAVIDATGKIIQQFLARAIAGMISSAATSGAPPPVALALAAAGAAAITGLMKKLTGQARGGGGSVSSSANSNSSTRFSRGANSFEITGRTIIKGQDLVVVYDKATANNKYTKPGG